MGGAPDVAGKAMANTRRAAPAPNTAIVTTTTTSTPLVTTATTAATAAGGYGMVGLAKMVGAVVELGTAAVVELTAVERGVGTAVVRTVVVAAAAGAGAATAVAFIAPAAAITILVDLAALTAASNVAARADVIIAAGTDIILRSTGADVIVGAVHLATAYPRGATAVAIDGSSPLVWPTTDQQRRALSACFRLASG